MIRVIGKLPKGKFGVACSGGVDSMAVIDFLTKDGNKELVCVYYNHGTEHSINAEFHVREFCLERGIELIIGEYSGEQPKSNKEAFWRDLRYDFFKQLDFPIITCHHLDDSIENWVFTSLRDFGKLIPYKNHNVIRPFLTTTKKDFYDWCVKRGVEWIDDPSNKSSEYTRNLIRNQMMPLILQVNSGIAKMIKKKIINEYKSKYEG